MMINSRRQHGERSLSAGALRGDGTHSTPSSLGWSDFPVLLGPYGLDANGMPRATSPHVGRIGSSSDLVAGSPSVMVASAAPRSFGWGDFPVLLGPSMFTGGNSIALPPSVTGASDEDSGSEYELQKRDDDLSSLLLSSDDAYGVSALLDQESLQQMDAEREACFGWGDFPLILGPTSSDLASIISSSMSSEEDAAPQSNHQRNEGSMLSSTFAEDAEALVEGEEFMDCMEQQEVSTVSSVGSSYITCEADISNGGEDDDDVSSLFTSKPDEAIRIQFDMPDLSSGGIFGWGDFPSVSQALSWCDATEEGHKNNCGDDEDAQFPFKPLHRRVPSLVETDDCLSVRSDTTCDDDTPSFITSSAWSVSNDKVTSTPSKKGILKNKEKRRNGSSEASSKASSNVSFSSVHIRDYALTLGDHPWSNSYPLSLDWKHTSNRVVAVDFFEASRAGSSSSSPLNNSVTGFKTPRRLTEYERRVRLLSATALDITREKMDELEKERRMLAQNEGINKSFIHPPVDALYIEELIRNSHQQHCHWICSNSAPTSQSNVARDYSCFEEVELGDN